MRFPWLALPVGHLDCRRGLPRTVAGAIFIAWCFLCFGVVMVRADRQPAETGKRGECGSRGHHLALARETPFHLALSESKACSSGSLKLLPPGDHALRVPPMPLDGPWVFVNLASPPVSFDGENLGYVPRECFATEDLPVENMVRQPRIDVVRTLSRGAGKRLLATAETPEEYQRLREKLFGWFGQTRNGCVAFLSTALRAARVPVPQRAVIEGDPVSLDTRPFVRYLEQDLGWQRIADVSAAQPGDIGVTEDNPRFPGYPGHVFLFAGWKDSRSLVAMVIDNQGFTHPRNLRKDPAWDYGPTQYFLRAPAEADR